MDILFKMGQVKKNADFYICGAFTQHPAGCTIFYGQGHGSFVEILCG